MDALLRRWADSLRTITAWRFKKSTPNPESQLSGTAQAARLLAMLLASGVPAARAQHRALTPELDTHPYGRLLLRVWMQASAQGAAPGNALQRFAHALTWSAENLRVARTLQVGPRSAHKVMMFLPVIALGGALLLGNNALEFLVMNPAGWMLLGCAGVLMWLGSRWSTRMIATATTSQWTSGLLSQLCAMYITSGSIPSHAVQLAQESLEQWDHKEFSEIAEMLQLAQEEGIHVVALLEGLSQHFLSESQTRMRESVEALSVKLVIPLGVCVLPAFICVGVIPIIFSMLSSTTFV